MFEKFPSHGSSNQEKGQEGEWDTSIYRQNERAIEYRAARSLETFYEDPKKAIEGLLGLNPTTVEKIDPEEWEDIENYIFFVSKRLAAGAVTSKAFHEQVAAGQPLAAIEVFNPDTAYQLGHDSLHAMFAYIKSGGSSLIPAYMKVNEIVTAQGRSEDNDANFEEHCVAAFSAPDIFLKPIILKLIEQGFRGDELSQKLIEEWTEEIQSPNRASRIQITDPEYIKANLHPEFLQVVKNYCEKVETGYVDPKEQLHQFRRILRPLLDRLKNKAPLVE